MDLLPSGDHRDRKPSILFVGDTPSLMQKGGCGLIRNHSRLFYIILCVRLRIKWPFGIIEPSSHIFAISPKMSGTSTVCRLLHLFKGGFYCYVVFRHLKGKGTGCALGDYLVLVLRIDN